MTLTHSSDAIDNRSLVRQALTDGNHLVVDALKLNEVHTIYGLVGIPITDLARIAQSTGIRYIGFRHESDAIHAAAAAGFLTRRPGVCLTVSGPGFLNGLVALANATTNCFPVVQISGSSERRSSTSTGRLPGPRPATAPQAVCEGGLSDRPRRDIGLECCTGHSYRGSGRPGGVYLDIPGRVLGRAHRGNCGAVTLWRVVDPAPRQLPAPEAVDRALRYWRGHSGHCRVGKGAATPKPTARFSNSWNHRVPFLPMSMAKGLLPDSTSPIRGGGTFTGDCAKPTRHARGARLNWLLGHGEAPQWIPDAKFIQVDIEASELDSNQPIAAPLPATSAR